MPLLSIVIPTHERFRYARETVRVILDMIDDVEVIVSDTSVTNAWAETRFDDSRGRLKVVRPGSGISVVENFNAALTRTTGDFVCFIGDDDLVTPAIMNIVRQAAADNVEVARVSFPILFYWADYRHRAQPEAYAGTVWASHYSGCVRPLDPTAALDFASAQLGRGVFNMPRAYCGIVSRALIERVVARYGALFGGVSPDIYSAALLAAEARRAVDIDFPAIVPGASGASTAGQSAAGQHVGGLRDNDHIRPFKDLVWHPFVPEFYSVPTVWSYSLIRALERIDGRDVTEAGWGRLYAQCLLYHRRYRQQTLSAMRAYSEATSRVSTARQVAQGVAAEMAWAAGRLRRRVSVARKVTSDRRVDGATDAFAAATIIERLIAEGPALSWAPIA
ncbi:glycosyltransferase family 2 protein [Sphingomonas phyllosphaerae]|uniref:glycosyltransferase family 2 protein n=1 Tax=Sphingomonas phyllosphaerae TaxID=257003 RepID=UPI002412FB7A|nr:glycosyltransferase [Sphingomonas phyllosphaerae]